MDRRPTVGFSWPFLDEVAGWSIGIASFVAIGSVVVTRGLFFALGCLAASVIDVVMVHIAVQSAIRAVEQERPEAFSGALLLGGRLLVKGALLGLALLVPSVVAFIGTAVGALAFDITLASVGSVLAVRQGFSRFSEGR